MIDVKDRIAVNPTEIVVGEIRHAVFAGEIPFVDDVRGKECAFVRMATPAEVFAYRRRRTDDSPYSHEVVSPVYSQYR